MIPDVIRRKKTRLMGYAVGGALFGVVVVTLGAMLAVNHLRKDIDLDLENRAGTKKERR